MRVMNMLERGGWAAMCAAALGLGGCYQGVDDHAPDGAGSPEDGEADPDDDPDEDPPQAQCEAPDVGETPLRRLTRAQYDNTVRDLLGVELGLAQAFVSDEKVGTFDSNAIASVTELSVEQYMDAAEQLAAEAVVDLPALLPCDPASIDEDECAAQFIDDFGPRAYRRPLTDEQREDALALYHHGLDQGSFADGIRVLVQGMLQSPFFLYHLEQLPPEGEGQVNALSPYEVASRLSYFLWESMPDDALRQAAAAGELSTPEQLQAQAERMIADPRAKDSIRHFHAQWLELEGLTQVDKDPELFPDFSPELLASMEEEVGRFVEHVILEGDGSLDTLMTADFTFADEELAALYGVEHPGGGFARVELPADERSGLLTLAGVMTAHAHHNQTSPVLRGAMVRENFLCQTPPPPPDTVNDNPPGLDPTLPTKQRYEQHREDPECAGCHVLLDPLGFGFEHFDALGQFRTMDGQNPVDATGEVVGADDADGPYDGHRELTERLAGSDYARACVSRQWFRYALGRLETTADACSLDDIYARFESSDYDIRELMVAIAVSDAVSHLKVAEAE